MEELGVIHGYEVRVDAEKVGWTMTVLCGVRIEKGRLIEVQRSISEDSRVFVIYDVTGDFVSMVL
ncbi:MAG: hypothetical protein MKZ56_06755, partial [Candidatus Thalassarchaeum sp.]|nr:hypothetical protein [Candidatus Thalassarchaeum sp.]